MYLRYVFYLTLLISFVNGTNEEPEEICAKNENKVEAKTCSQSCSAATNRYSKQNEISEDKKDVFVAKSNDDDLDEMALIEAGMFEMGSNDAHFKADREGPIRNVTLKAFYIDKYSVSNEKFAKFIHETNYVTDAEKYGNSFVFDQLLPENERNDYPDLRAVQAQWWIKLDGVTWNHPEGPNSNIEDKMNHPVVHVSWHDAKAYCSFYKKRLPTEEEWEKACRGGLRQKLFPWGNDLMAKKVHRTNIWQGTFPRENTKDDGYFGTCPVDAYFPNKFGLYNMVGNVWEWTSTLAFNHSKVDRIKKGGSFMCHKSYCYRYRCAARSHNTDDSTASNLGFRCAKDSDVVQSK